ncbi:MAG: alkaline phosphatase D family protein [Flavobacteriales bacterium]
MQHNFIALLTWLLLAVGTNAQTILKSGPMLGYVDMREACVWVQTDRPCSLHVYYWKKNEKDGLITQSPLIVTTQAEENIAHMILACLDPGTTYSYTFDLPHLFKSPVYEFTTQTLWQYRTDPPAFRVATGSCAYINETEYDRPGEPYGGGLQIFDTIAARKPDMMLWLGDNIYLREVDYGSRSGIIHRYNHTRAQPALQKLLSTCPQYAIWDDHDYGPNDADASYVHKDWTLEAFKMYWANPSYGIPNTDCENTIATQFTFVDVDFFLLDNRTNKVVPGIQYTDSSTVLGREQVDWLIQALRYSHAPFKLVAIGSQFLNPVAKFENYACYAAERQLILDAIDKNNITGVIFLTGDRHCAELSELKLPGGNMVYDLTTSPLTSKAYDNTKEENTLRVEGTLVSERNFATLDFSGPLKKRILTISLWNNNGELKWKREIEQN